MKPLITGPQCHAGRALVQWSRQHLASSSQVALAVIEEFERYQVNPPDDVNRQLRRALEKGGAVFLAENGDGGAGVRLKFSSKDARAIKKWEGEGGSVGDDDV